MAWESDRVCLPCSLWEVLCDTIFSVALSEHTAIAHFPPWRVQRDARLRRHICFVQKNICQHHAPRSRICVPPILSCRFEPSLRFLQVFHNFAWNVWSDVAVYGGCHLILEHAAREHPDRHASILGPDFFMSGGARICAVVWKAKQEVSDSSALEMGQDYLGGTELNNSHVGFEPVPSLFSRAHKNVQTKHVIGSSGTMSLSTMLQGLHYNAPCYRACIWIKPPHTGVSCASPLKQRWALLQLNLKWFASQHQKLLYNKDLEPRQCCRRKNHNLILSS